jgi:hypothetical protein
LQLPYLLFSYPLGTAGNHDFGGVEETGILVTIADIYPSKKERHIRSYKKNTLP